MFSRKNPIGTGKNAFLSALANLISIFPLCAASRVLSGAILIVASVALAADPLEHWTWRNPLPQGKNLRAIAYGNGTYVTAGDDGTVLTSPDGHTWTTRDFGTSDPVDAIVFGKGLFVATAGTGVRVSTNGIDWKPYGESFFPTSLAYGNDTFVAVGYSQDIFVSSNALTWRAISRPSAADGALSGVTFGDDGFVAVGGYGDGTIIYKSADGTNWVDRSVTNISYYPSITYGNGGYYLLSHSWDSLLVLPPTSLLALTSTNGDDWDAVFVDGYRYLGKAIIAGTNYVAIDISTIYLSQDGRTWDAQYYGQNSLADIIYANGLAIAVGEGGEIVSSTNLVDWERVTQGPPLTIYSVAFGHGTFVGARDFAPVITSTNGVDWIAQTTPLDFGMRKVIYAQDMFLVQGGGSIFTSQNGTDWTNTFSSDLYPALNDLAYGNGRFVAVGGESYSSGFSSIAISTNGLDWDSQINMGEVRWQNVIYGNGVFLATKWDYFAQPDADLMISTNGHDWSLARHFDGAIGSLAFGNGVFVAHSEYIYPTRVYTSTDGNNWAEHIGGYFDSPAGQVVFTGGTFLANGYGGVLSSFDGIHWSSHPSALANGFNDAISAHDSIFTFGAYGRILQSDSIVSPSILTQPHSRTTLYGTDATFTIEVTTNAFSSLQWQCNGVDLPGETNNTLTVRHAQSSNAGTYTVRVQSLSGSLLSDNAVLELTNGRPALVFPLASQFTFVGRPITLLAIAAGSADMTFQWRKNGIAIPGATNSALTFNATGAGDAGRYSVAISNSFGVFTSREVTLTVYSALSGRPNRIIESPGGTSNPPDITNAVAIAPGAYHALALTSDGTVVGWPYNFSPPDDPNYAIPDGLTNITAIAAYHHSLALREDGTVIGWGNNTYGEATPPDDLTNAVAIALGDGFSLALRADGTVTSWGIASIWNGDSNVPEDLTNLVAIAAHASHSLALKADGTVVGWSASYFENFQIPAGLTNVVSIATADNLDLALKGDGTVVGWGFSDEERDRTLAGLSNVVAIAAGGRQEWLILKSDGTVVGSSAARGLRNVSAIAQGDREAYAITDSKAPLLLGPYCSGTFLTVTGNGDQIYEKYVGSSTGLYIDLDGHLPTRLQWFKNGQYIPRATNSYINFPRLTEQDSGSYSVVARNRAGVTVSATAELRVLHPKFTITSPRQRSEVSDERITAEGTVEKGYTVFLRSFSGSFSDLVGDITYTTNLVHNREVIHWSLPLALGAGWNFFEFVSVDERNHQSPPLELSVFRVSTVPLTIVINGQGNVGPYTNGQMLVVGMSYKMVARPARGQIFAGWNFQTEWNSFSSPFQEYSLPMQSNLVATATFIPNPFQTRGGLYNGLFYRDVVDHESSGFTTIRVTGSGAFSGRLLTHGKNHPFSGRFGAAHPPASPNPRISYPNPWIYWYQSLSSNEIVAPFYIIEPQGRTLFVTLRLNLSDESAGLMTGDVIGAGHSILIAEQADAHATNRAGQYTLSFPSEVQFQPGFVGDGIGYAKVNSHGNLRFIGRLADGTAVSQSVAMSASGHWPLYLPLYEGKGSLLSWGLLSQDQPPTDPLPIIPGISAFSWIKTGPPGALFRGGFTNQGTMLTSHFVNATRADEPPLDFGVANLDTNLTLKDAAVAFTGGDLAGTLYEYLSVSEENLWTDTVSGNNTRLRLDQRTGWLNGAFVNPETDRKIKVSAVLLEDRTSARGFFLGTNQGGMVLIRPR